VKKLVASCEKNRLSHVEIQAFNLGVEGGGLAPRGIIHESRTIVFTKYFILDNNLLIIFNMKF
jgi:hypothetical protein